MAARRKRNTERTRAVILEAASQLFVTEGYEAVTVRRIAEQAKISHGTIYIHFKDKDDLLYQTSEDQFSRLLSRIRRLPRSREPVRRLYEAMMEVIRFGIEYPNDYQLMMGFRTTFGGPKSENQWGPNSEQVGTYFEDLLREAMESGDLVGIDEQRDERMLLSTMHGAILMIVSTGLDRETADGLAERIVTTMLRGLGGDV